MRVFKESALVVAIESAIKELLATMPLIKLEKTSELPSNVQPDLVLSIGGVFSTKYLIVEVKSNGEPRYVRSAIQQLKEYTAQIKKAYGIVGAPYISDNSANICKRSGVGYIDTAGNCYINFDRVLIERKNYPNPNIVKRTLRSIFSKKATRILRVMLANPKKQWQVQEIAREANVSLGLAYKVKERLFDLDYAAETKKLISITQPQELLTKWAENYTYRKNKIYNFYSSDAIKQMEMKLSEYCRKKKIIYALTLFSGAARVAPYTRYTRGFAYINENIKDIPDAMGLKGVDSGANFTLMDPYDDGIFYGTKEVQGTAVVSDVQLYLDLKSYKGRGEDAAQFLLEQRIKTLWQS